MNVDQNATEEARLKRLQEASEWLVRMEDPGRTEEDVNEWLRWCYANPENLSAFETYQHDWHDLDVLKSNPRREAPPPGCLERPANWKSERLSALRCGSEPRRP